MNTFGINNNNNNSGSSSGGGGGGGGGGHNINNSQQYNNNNSNNHHHPHHRLGVYDGKIAGLYDLEETLGSGHFAVVKLARHVFTGEKVAVKVIDKTKLDEVSRAHLFQEVRCMKLVQHPNVVRLYEVIDTQTKLYLILELGDGGDLYDYIMKHDGGLTEQLAKEYFRQIVRAITYCHQLHVVHRDLKPENVVFFEKLGVVKLTDFGFSNKFCPGQKLETSCGSLAYSAPEILLGDSYDAPAVDIWSLGVILYMLVCGHPPFQEANDSETLTMIMDCKYTIPPHISEECKQLIGTMLVVAPDKRSTLTQISQSLWLVNDTGNGGGGGVGGGPEIEVPEYLPLVSRQQVSDDDHTLIIQKMVNGNIAGKEEIIEALDKNEYNHITATYFLLAERKLRAQRQEQALKHRPELSLPVSNSSRLSPKSRLQGLKDEFLQSSKNTNGLSSISTSTTTSSSSSASGISGPSIGIGSRGCGGHLSVPKPPETLQTGRIRKCSIVQEEEDDEDDADAEESITLNRRGSRSEGRINITVQDRIAASAAAASASSAEQERLKNEITECITELPNQETVVDSATIVSNTNATATNAVASMNQQKGGLFDGGVCGVTIVRNSDNDPKGKLGAGNLRFGFQKRCLPIAANKSSTVDTIGAISVTDGSVGGGVVGIGSSLSARSMSVDQGPIMYADADVDEFMPTTSTTESFETKFLIDSSTISIPINSSTSLTAAATAELITPKYKTMPSPTRSSCGVIGGVSGGGGGGGGSSIGSNYLNEIYEEGGTDIGSSDTSAQTTPRPSNRHANFVNNRSATSASSTAGSITSGGGGGSAASTGSQQHRRSKFHKTRTASCSSSDASDDDSENRKKRAHKIVDSTKPLAPQRRDSHDDSSDSQEPTAPSSSGGTTASYKLQVLVSNGENGSGGGGGGGSGDGDDNGGSQDGDGSGGSNGNGTSTNQQKLQHHKNDKSNNDSTSNRQKSNSGSGSSVGFRRHRTGRRRAGETRLRESQSLNRITEVQESELPLNSLGHQQQQSVHSTTTTNTIMTNCSETTLATNSSTITSTNSTFVQQTSHQSSITTIISTSNIISVPVSKPKGFSARLFHGFRKSDTPPPAAAATATPTSSSDLNVSQEHQHQQHLLLNQSNLPADDEAEMVLGVELAKAIKVNDTSSTSATSKSSSTTKKLKILGRYFQVHKKLCIPLPGIFQRSGRLYKAQSCSSIMRDKITQPSCSISNANASTNIKNTSHISGSGTHKLNNTGRHSALFSTDKQQQQQRVLRNCLGGAAVIGGIGGGARFLGSDSDINQNNDKLGVDDIDTSPIVDPLVFSMRTLANSYSSETDTVVGGCIDGNTTKAFNIPKTSSPLHHHQSHHSNHHQHHQQHHHHHHHHHHHNHNHHRLSDVSLCSSKC